MLRSLYSGVSGMKGFQTKMDVLANNIANVNTTAFKSSRVGFQDMLSQTIASAQGPVTDGLGGVNPKQIGLGVKVGSIDMMMGNGALQSTSRELDFAIEGNGFFIIQSSGDGENLYSRDGVFFRDKEGILVNSNGQKVLDKDGKELKISDKDGDDQLQSFTIDGTGKITGVYGTDGKIEDLGVVGLATFTNPEGLEKRGNNNYAKTNNSGDVNAGNAGEPGFGVIRQGFLEMSNVDLANEFTEMVIASRAYSANSRSITTSDEMLQELINLKR
ncbi:MAG: flagellar hook-basal body complex protein [Gudongella sp.]|nr:flagellar hook-basal body complex protein [Gudongella sp.]